MSKSIFLFEINKDFSSLKKDNNIDIILDIFLKAIESKFYKEQFNLMIKNIDIEIIKNNVFNYFKNKENFYVDNEKFLIHNIYKENDEIIYFNNNYLKIIYDDKSIFLEYLSMFFIDLIAIDLEDKKIYPLHLVKSNILV